MLRLRNVYLYLVCFVTLMMILFGTIFTVQSITDLLFPTRYYSYPTPAKTPGMTPEEQKQAEMTRIQEEQNQQNQNKKGVAKSIAVALVALPTFAYHWRKIEREKKENADTGKKQPV